MNTDDPNNPQGGSAPSADIPASDTNTPATEPAQETPQPMGGNEPAPTEGGMDATAANCHCGKPSTGGNCTGCNMPEATCNCAPAA
ncbi:hypothetical protein A3F00_02695 [Candidatus Daviesbacteria bacterium RIFCSPHIGHO2_12_FULL_37_11]|uniref:Uncharacterized protein n=1 Tax=Candidatus Daviesbacteria bacterium RIFCSPHIGHO2_12_FULL_37_11 TaxID=1797777 RepID=A0A1F5KEQ7_9BACT|nr:MAG: hypothetical protein A2111_01030 [Candidatus Daviesbacteria bacterium GWA1_38_6]OGE16249.1 MAG: hypothetical protein A2769_02520 [Candidatus Daviesbacteria bacterium RIFCSPHIGHO2_01_FULL_37_27]OGE39344.1 MAG: hypothetical protein A3F00_02695 [Candidatus Daviesbacteria bacterium RIFCSPHIGHO2_12_FULL_37_11]OGE45140.1 MAG: hypothetical protein A3B39_01865 [Candidatus Daviesbacteria bacterium RIFCSPLOWO2_01_FULL_37_10]